MTADEKVNVTLGCISQILLAKKISGAITENPTETGFKKGNLLVYLIENSSGTCCFRWELILNFIQCNLGPNLFLSIFNGH